MNIAQIKSDLDAGVMVCSATWRELVEWAVKVEAKNLTCPGKELSSDEIDAVMNRFGKYGLDYPSRTRLHDLVREFWAIKMVNCCGTPNYCNSVRRCTDQDSAREHLAELLAAVGEKEKS